jgi:hypothetical protein
MERSRKVECDRVAWKNAAQGVAILALNLPVYTVVDLSTRFLMIVHVKYGAVV